MKTAVAKSDGHRDKTWRIELPESEIGLRDYLAAQAIHCFMLTNENVARLEKGIGYPMHEVVAKFCYGLADAMLRERECQRT